MPDSENRGHGRRKSSGAASRSRDEKTAKVVLRVRKWAGLNQQDFASLLGLSSKSSISEIEKGKRKLTGDALHEFVGKFGFDPNRPAEASLEKLLAQEFDTWHQRSEPEPPIRKRFSWDRCRPVGIMLSSGYFLYQGYGGTEKYFGVPLVDYRVLLDDPTVLFALLVATVLVCPRGVIMACSAELDAYRRRWS